MELTKENSSNSFEHNINPGSASVPSWINNSVLSEIANHLGEYWKSPEQITSELRDLLNNLVSPTPSDIYVSGETDNISLYVIDSQHIVIIMPFADVRSNIILTESGNSDQATYSWNFHVARIAHIPSLDARLKWPRLLLINLSVVENFPIPRLSLSVASLASYVRKKQMGVVKIIDMQMGDTTSKVVSSALSFRPDVIGLSISYGQGSIALALLDELAAGFAASRQINSKPLIIAGNVIPASYPAAFIDRFPQLLVAGGEGELTIVGLLRHLTEGIPLTEVPGLIRKDVSGLIVHNPLESVPMSDLPFPALDTLDELVEHSGALTLELSRGCQYNVCTFCPRHHKAKSWKAYSASEALLQLELISKVMTQASFARRLFIADEEFIGTIPNDEAATRIMTIASGIIDKKLNLQFDAEARVDQIYDPKRSKEWHLTRLAMWSRLRDAGLDRLFMGIESGAANQLKRYGKGTSAQQAITAVRFLTSLGIGLRFGFIMFDPLMKGFQDLKDNLCFLERTDVILRPQVVAPADLYDSILYDPEFIHAQTENVPLYSVVSYMLANLEVLINSPYERMIQNANSAMTPDLFTDGGRGDLNMGRRKVRYIDPLIGCLSDHCQRWIDRNFSLAYTLKSLFKVAKPIQRTQLMSYMVQYRKLSHFLLKTMIYIFDPTSDDLILGQLAEFHRDDIQLVVGMRNNRGSVKPAHTLKECLELFEYRLSHLVSKIRCDLDAEANCFVDRAAGTLKGVTDLWYEQRGNWSLINDPARFQPA